MSLDGKIGIALLSFAHVHARGYADQVRDHADCAVRAIWDEDAERGRTEAEKRGVEFVESLDEALGRSDVDGVVVMRQPRCTGISWWILREPASISLLRNPLPSRWMKQMT